MAMDWEQNSLINELNQGKQVAEELMKHLNCISSPQTREFLLQKLLCSYEKAISMLNWNAFPVPNSSPASDICNSDCKDPNQINVKRRKTQYTEQVKVCSGSSLEGPIHDGYSWRKYGQKHILGANFPRGYYRCSHRHSQGCLAVKQVQRSDADLSVFDVTYKGRHTCVQASHLPLPNDISKQNHSNTKKQVEENSKPAENEFFTIEDLGIFPSPFTFLEKEDEGTHQNLGDFSPAFVSPSTSESNYFSTSSCHVDNLGMGYNVQTPESNLNEIISFPTEDFDFFNFEFDKNFPIENLEFVA